MPCRAALYSPPTQLLTALHCNTLHHTVTPCTMLQHTAAHCNTLHDSGEEETRQKVRRVMLDGALLTATLLHAATHCNTLQHTATCCNTLQHAATCCNMLQHTTTHSLQWRRSNMQEASARHAARRSTRRQCYRPRTPHLEAGPCEGAGVSDHIHTCTRTQNTHTHTDIHKRTHMKA